MYRHNFKKITLIFLSTLLVALFLLSCGGSAATTTATTTGTTDAVASASIVDTAEAFEKAISKDGTWIIASLKDITTDKELVLDGDFTNGRKDTAGKDIYQRKIGLYTQDANRNVLDRFKLTAPKLTINSRNASFEYGTFVGDLYVAVPNFKLIDARVEGNVYFKTEEIKNSFNIDSKSVVTGTQEVRSF